jgi:hypothetical protein
MEDSLNYMNAVSEASQALNQVSALRQEAEMQFQQKKEQLGQELQLPSEISITSAGAYLGKKALGYVSEKFGSTISEAASKVGISEETVGRALSGDITGALEQGAGEVSQMAEGIVGGAISEAQGLVGGAVSEAQGLVGGIVGQAEGVIGRISGGLENIGSINLPSISPEIDIGNLYSQGLEDLRAQAGIDENMFRDFTNVSIENSRPFSFNNPAPQEVEMTDFSTIGTPSTTIPAESLGTSTAEASTAEAPTVGETAGEAGIEAGVETAAEVGGAEAAGAALDVTGILAPVGALVGLIGGLVGFFEGTKEESETMPVIPTPILNPSSQFL